VETGQTLVRRLAQVFGLRLDRAGVEERVMRGWGAHLLRFPSLEPEVLASKFSSQRVQDFGL
jgi:hypothetical protein